MPFFSITDDNLDTELNEKLKSFNKEYEKAEEILKEAELIDIEEGLAFPPVNELRYAAKHLSRFFTSTDRTSALKEIDSALSHVKRAQYDAYDICITDYLTLCAHFDKEFKKIPITKIRPEYTEDIRIINNIKKNISRRNREEIDFFDEIQKEIINIRQIYENWDACRSELNKIKLREAWSRRIAIMAILIPIIIALLNCITRNC